MTRTSASTLLSATGQRSGRLPSSDVAFAAADLDKTLRATWTPDWRRMGQVLTTWWDQPALDYAGQANRPADMMGRIRRSG